MIVVYVSPTGEVEVRREATPIKQALGDTELGSQAVVVLAIDEYAGTGHIIKDRYNWMSPMITQGSTMQETENERLRKKVSRELRDEAEEDFS